MSLHNLQEKVVEAAVAVCDNAAPLPDSNVQIPADLCNALGEALCNLADMEAEIYKDHLSPGQQGLNSAQVSLQRLEMDEKALKIERAIDAADRLYITFFDVVAIPGHAYIALPLTEVGDVEYAPKSAIEEFQKAVMMLTSQDWKR